MRQLFALTFGWLLATAGSVSLAVAAVGVVSDEVVAPTAAFEVVHHRGVAAEVRATGGVHDLAAVPVTDAPILPAANGTDGSDGEDGASTEPAPAVPGSRADDQADATDGSADAPRAAAQPSGTAATASSAPPSDRDASSAGTSAPAGDRASAADGSAAPSDRSGHAAPSSPPAAQPQGPSARSQPTREEATAASPPPAPTSGPAERRTYRLVLGTVTVSFAEGDVHVVQYTPNCDDCTVTIDQRRPDRVRIVFEAPGRSSRLDATWRAGAPDTSVQEKGHDKAATQASKDRAKAESAREAEDRARAKDEGGTR